MSRRTVQINYPFIQHESPICLCESAAELEFLMRKKYYIGFSAVAVDKETNELLASYCTIGGYRTLTEFEPATVG